MKNLKKTELLKIFAVALEQGVTELSIEANFRDLPDWDSLASVMLVAEIYAQYGVQISGDELESCQSLAELKAVIEEKL
jgi:acyl carrier protein